MPDLHEYVRRLLMDETNIKWTRVARTVATLAPMMFALAYIIAR